MGYHYRNIETNDLVLLKKENITGSNHTLARVLKTYSGKNGVVRIVKVKIPSNTLVYPAGKICLMEKYAPAKFTSKFTSTNCENVLTKPCRLIHWLESAMIYSMSTDKVKTVL